MQPSIGEGSHSREMNVVLRELGSSIRLSLDSTIIEPLPAEMGLLLLRLALVEVLKMAAEDETREIGVESLPEEWNKALRQSIGVGFVSLVG